ncbi:sce7726 family protein [Brevundimonas sp. A19_0]|uniref:sce7726 family protein n=1 Tax=Brevundimonas sp. A19_0 TaxID=2821087 RepID=UPI001ADA350B|nr:sce7726 family protein [Brevundimonas sp. A19_0]MBO9501997.1 sce7726 family protein [Brevundimonas sp. A19_0]
MPVHAPVFDERTIKAELLTKLWREGSIDKTTVLTSEFRLQNTGVRADIAILTNHLTGVEIKSGKDSLKRLRQQMDVYRAYFDRVVLVVAPKHLASLAEIDIVGVELWSIDSTKHFRMLKPGSICDNAAARYAKMPERDRKRYAHLSERDAFDMIFRDRFHQTSDAFWKSIGRARRIPKDSLKYLSRFREKRELHIEWEHNQERRWVEWHRKASDAFSNNASSDKTSD